MKLFYVLVLIMNAKQLVESFNLHQCALGVAKVEEGITSGVCDSFSKQVSGLTVDLDDSLSNVVQVGGILNALSFQQSTEKELTAYYAECKTYLIQASNISQSIAMLKSSILGLKELTVTSVITDWKEEALVQNILSKLLGGLLDKLLEDVGKVLKQILGAVQGLLGMIATVVGQLLCQILGVDLNLSLKGLFVGVVNLVRVVVDQLVVNLGSCFNEQLVVAGIPGQITFNVDAASYDIVKNQCIQIQGAICTLTLSFNNIMDVYAECVKNKSAKIKSCKKYECIKKTCGGDK